MVRKESEFERIALPHARVLLAFALRLARNPAVAEDLVQEALLLAWRSFGQLQSEGQIKPWLFRILYNAFLAHVRKSRASPQTVELALATPATSPPDFDSVEVLQALDRLTLDHRAVLVLAVLDGFTCREIAEILSIPLGTAMSRLSRAREAMRALLCERVKVAQ
jgi:RNA polymerase sigma-70 factor (ECF subfamily)